MFDFYNTMANARSGYLGLMILFLGTFLTACTSEKTTTKPEIHRTSHGIPHIVADSYEGVGFGLAYAYASDNLCLLAEQVIMVNGERSLYFGVEGKNEATFVENLDNLTSDFFYRYIFNEQALNQQYKKTSETIKALISGYMDGYNTYVRHRADQKILHPCTDAPWVREITMLDMYKLLEEKMIMGGIGALPGYVVAATPPGQAQKKQTYNHKMPDRRTFGSNGWAFGSEATQSGAGMQMANPHFPWGGTNRFYQAHIIGPDGLNVMGATIAPLPVLSMGFNENIAWSHTVSAAHRFTFFELDLVKGEPLQYKVDGEIKSITTKSISVPVRGEDGGITHREHMFYETELGPVVSVPEAGLVWSQDRAYVIADVNKGGAHSIDMWLELNTAKSVQEVKAILARYRAATMFNTLAADRDGYALYADIGRLPNIDREIYDMCEPSPGAQAVPLLVLNGSKQACLWPLHEAEDRLLPVTEQAAEIGKNYYLNSNDSYWLVQPEKTAEVLSPIMGDGVGEQGKRTRHGMVKFARARTQGPITPDIVEEILLSNRSYSANLALAATLTLCTDKNWLEKAGENNPKNRRQLKTGCKVLAGWDGTANINSAGAPLFREYWRAARNIENHFMVPFSADDPVNTPRILAINDENVREGLHRALIGAVDKLESFGFGAGIPLGKVQGVTRNGKRIAMHGGMSWNGILNLNHFGALTSDGYEPLSMTGFSSGASYIHIATFDENGPVVKGILAYSQSVNPNSPYYADQTQLYSDKKLYKFLYRWEDIINDDGYYEQDIP